MTPAKFLVGIPCVGKVKLQGSIRSILKINQKKISWFDFPEISASDVSLIHIS